MFCFFTVNSRTMKPSLLLVGLGNYGSGYTKTRHNAGFRAIDVLSDDFGVGEWSEKPKFVSSIQEGRVVMVPVLLVKPHTYMNRSGEAIAKLIDFYSLSPAENLLVFCDDVDLPLGELRLRKKGGPGTHNGLKSIVHVFGEDFARIRIGLGAQPQGTDLSAWVLSAFSKEEADEVNTALRSSLPEMVKKYILL